MVLSRRQEIELRDKYFIPKEPLISSLGEVGTNISPAYTSIVESARYNFNSIFVRRFLPQSEGILGVLIRQEDARWSIASFCSGSMNWWRNWRADSEGDGGAAAARRWRRSAAYSGAAAR